LERIVIAGERLPSLETPRLVLRWLEEHDLRALERIFSHPEVLRYWGGDPTPDAAAARALLQQIRDGFGRRDLFQWGIARRADDLVVGTCTLARIDARNRRAEVGFALGREHWGHGYVAEAMATLLGFAFRDLDLVRLEADADPRNERSLAVLERLGFRREGLLRERWLVGGEAQDSLVLGLLRREWLRSAEAAPDENALSPP
jgi:RimJ/RimL family protein N-acetyltransferase